MENTGQSPFKKAMAGPQFRSGEYLSLMHRKNTEKKKAKTKQNTKNYLASSTGNIWMTVQYIAILRTNMFTKTYQSTKL